MKVVAGIKGAVKANEDGMQISLFIPRNQVNFDRALKNLSQLSSFDSMDVEFNGEAIEALEEPDL